MATKTAGELIKELQKFNPSTPVVVTVWESHMTDSGTDMGSDIERTIGDVTDLESRLVIDTRSQYYPPKKSTPSSTPGYAGRDEQGGSDS